MAIDITLRRDLARLLTDVEVDDNFIAIRDAAQGVLDALGKAEGYASLGTDGRLPQAQAPILLAEALPAGPHDLNSYQTPGNYRQASTAGAQAGTNYPQATGGLLEVCGSGSPGQTVQRYTVASTGSVSPTSGTRQYWRFAINASWSPWQEVHTAGNSLPYLGRVEAGADLNSYANRGMWAISASSTAAGGTNFPIANSGWLLVYCEAAAGGAAGTNVNQVYIGSNGNRQFFRSLVGGAWSAWEEVVRSSQLGALNGVATLDGNGRLVQPHAFSSVLAAGTDANIVVFPGFYYLNSDAQATAALNWPAQLAGTLQVEAAGAGNLQITQAYTTRNGAGGVIRTYKRVRFGTSGTWGTWQEVARLADAVLQSDKGVPGGVAALGSNGQVPAAQLPPLAHGQCRFVSVSNTACRLIPLNGNGLIINGRQYRIPEAGIDVTNAGLAANTLYYAYARDDGTGAIVIDFLPTASNPHSKHSDGVEIRTGNPGYTLVGWVFTNSLTQIVSSAMYRYCVSWFNRKIDAVVEPASNNTTASTAYVKLQNGVYGLMWAGDSATVSATGIVRPGVSGGGGGYMVMTINGTAISGGQGYTLSAAAGSQQASVCTTAYTASTDVQVNFAPYGFTSAAANPVTFYHDVSMLILI